MIVATARRVTVIIMLSAAAVVVAAAIAFACVPQQGRLQVENNEGTSPPARFDTSTEAAQSESSDWIVGDGNDGTLHFESWCGEEGGHPTSAVWAHDGDELKVTVGAASPGDVDSSGSDKCPKNGDGSKLPTAGEGTGDNTWIYLENGVGNDAGDQDVYKWDESDPDYPNGFWNFSAGDGKGCYPDDRNPINQDPNGGASFRVDSNGDGTHTFDLIADRAQDTLNGSPGDPDSNPGDGASVLCVGDETVDGNGEKAIFAPVVVMQV